MARVSHVPRALRILEAEGYVAERVERYISFGGRGGVRRDLFGIGDVLAIRDGEILMVQVCGASTLAAHRRKALESELLEAWRRAGGAFEIFSFRKVRGRYVVRRERL